MAMADRTSSPLPSPTIVQVVEMEDLPPRFPEETTFSRYVDSVRRARDLEDTPAHTRNTPASEAQKDQIHRLRTSLRRTRRLVLLFAGIAAPMALLALHASASVPQVVLLRSLDGVRRAWEAVGPGGLEKRELLRGVQFADANATSPGQVERYFRTLGWEELVNRTLTAPAEVNPAETVAVVQLFVRGLAGVLEGTRWDSTENLYPRSNIAITFLLAFPAVVSAGFLLYFSIRPLTSLFTRAQRHHRRPRTITQHLLHGLSVFYVVIQCLCFLYTIILICLLFKSTCSNTVDWRLRAIFGTGNMIEKKVARILGALGLFLVAALSGEIGAWVLEK